MISMNEMSENKNRTTIVVNNDHNNSSDIDEGFHETHSVTSNSLTPPPHPPHPPHPPQTPQSDNDSSLILSLGRSGSIRGKRNVVQKYKQLIENSQNKSEEIREKRDYKSEEMNKCVLYLTSCGIIRNTFENCRKIKAILTQHMIRYESRDIYICPNFRQEIIERLGELRVPALFASGHYVGSVDVVERLNECLELVPLLSSFRMSVNAYRRSVCRCCGDVQHIPCLQCNGSRKSAVLHFRLDSISLRCSACNASGIVACPVCVTHV